MNPEILHPGTRVLPWTSRPRASAPQRQPTARARLLLLLLTHVTLLTGHSSQDTGHCLSGFQVSLDLRGADYMYI